jgi:hypothetical protein
MFADDLLSNSGFWMLKAENDILLWVIGMQIVEKSCKSKIALKSPLLMANKESKILELKLQKY